METIVLTTECDLRKIIADEIGKFIKKETPKTEPVYLAGTTKAVDFLRRRGYELSESLFQKQSALGTIPCKRFHNKRLLFSEPELLMWAESKCVKIGDESDATMILAKNANKKLNRGGRRKV